MSANYSTTLQYRPVQTKYTKSFIHYKIYFFHLLFIFVRFHIIYVKLFLHCVYTCFAVSLLQVIYAIEKLRYVQYRA